MSPRERLAEQLAHIPPTDLERDPVGVVMCGLLVDLLDALTAIQRLGQGTAETSDGPNRDGDTAVPAPPATDTDADADVQAEGDQPVLLQEPDVPDTTDGDTGLDARDQALAEQPTTARSGRPTPRARAAKKKTTKATPPAE